MQRRPLILPPLIFVSSTPRKGNGRALFSVDLSLSLSSFQEETKNSKNGVTAGDWKHALPPMMTATTALKFKKSTQNRGDTPSIQPRPRSTPSIWNRGDNGEILPSGSRRQRCLHQVRRQMVSVSTT
ncbi:unnamed protein product [Linum tenue]|uniref:Uncharacterized protein n=1 Tax=Linum tenue TaxID=586396 RepID=A0AAV0IXZ0_9ROSI|nr:unnamed protein product [Linum tenue]